MVSIDLLVAAVFSFRRHFRLALVACIAFLPHRVFSQEIRPEIRVLMEEMNKPFLLESEMKEGNPKFTFFKNAARASAVASCAFGADLVDNYSSTKAFLEWRRDNNSIRLTKEDLAKMTTSMQFSNATSYLLRSVGCDNLLREDVYREDSMRPYLEPYFGK